MAAFEPQFTWKNGVISEKELPIILRSVNPFIPGKDPIIARMKGTEEDSRLAATTSTELAIKAQQYTKKVEVPAELLRPGTVLFKFSFTDSFSYNSW